MPSAPVSSVEKELQSRGKIASFKHDWSASAEGYKWSEERVLRAEFLTNYILEKRDDLRSLEIADVFIDGAIYLEHSIIKMGLRFSRCEFSNSIFLSDATLTTLYLTECRLRSQLFAIGTLISKDLQLHTCSFLEPASFLGATINGTIVLSGSSFVSADDDPAISFQAATIGQGVRCRDGFYCYGAVDFQGATLLGGIEFCNCKILGPNAKIGFEEADVRGSLTFDHATVHGPIDINSARIHRHLILIKCRLIKKGSLLSLHSTTIDGPLVIDKSRVSNGIILIAFQTKSFLEIRHSLVGRLDENHSILGNGVAVGLGLYFRNGSRFTKQVSLTSANIGNSVMAKGAKFYDQSISIDLQRSNISGGIEFSEKTTCMGTANFEDCEIKASAIFSGSHFPAPSGEFDTPSDQTASRSSAKLNLSHARVGQAVKMNDGFCCDGKISLNNTRIEGDFNIASYTKNPNEIRSLICYGLKVQGAFLMHKGLKIGHLDLRDASCRTLIDSEDCWPPRGQLKLDRFNYESIGGNAPTDVPTRLNWLRRQAPDHVGKQFKPQPYEKLAQVFRLIGHEVDARTVLIEKQRKLRDAGRFGGFFARLRHSLLDIVVGYGYRPTNSLKLGLILMLFGWVIFHIGHANGFIAPTKTRMVMSQSVNEYKPSEALSSLYPSFNGLIYSIDAFLPVLDLQQENYWVPRSTNHDGEEDQFFRWYYWLHTMLGWLITTIAIAGFTGLIKRD